MTLATDIPVLDWNNCYEGSWRDIIVPEAFAHPAKFAPELIRRIYAHGIARGWWKRGDTVADPFGGIAGGGILAGYAGLNWIGVELESRFVELGNRNLALHGPKWMAMGGASCVKLIQGDSRRFAEIVGDAVAVVTSPPYAASLHLSEPPEVQIKRMIDKGQHTAIAKSSRRGQFVSDSNAGYGASNGQIAALPAGDIAAVVTSPPYAESVKGDHAERETAEDSRAARRTPGGSLGQSARHGGYGLTDGQIGALREGMVEAVVTSPPYSDTSVIGASQVNRASWGKGVDLTRGAKGEDAKNYGQHENQIGGLNGETYWQAMSQVYASCRAAIRPGGIMAVVVKDYVSKKQRVPLCDQTLRLLTHLGFQPVERIRAWLVREERSQGLWGEHVKKTERKSFFRRLAEKNGSPRIDWEEVLIVRSAIAAGAGGSQGVGEG